MAMSRKLPIGIQSFQELREGGYLYVDKTRYISQMVETGKTYFLNRPRRFGKSLLVSTMEAYFEGKKELFHGLAIAQTEAEKGEDAWISYPVIRFSLSGGSYQEENGLSDRLGAVIDECIDTFSLTEEYAVTGETLPVRFLNLIKKLYLKTGRQWCW